jgi:hypothetical protein
MRKVNGQKEFIGRGINDEKGNRKRNRVGQDEKFKEPNAKWQNAT